MSEEIIISDSDVDDDGTPQWIKDATDMLVGGINLLREHGYRVHDIDVEWQTDELFEIGVNGKPTDAPDVH